MKTVRNLPRLWSALTRSSGIITPAITTDQIDFWMSLHPDFGGFCFAVWQEVNDLVALQVYQDRAEFSATTERKIIYSQLEHLFDWLCWECHNTSKNGEPA